MRNTDKQPLNDRDKEEKHKTNLLIVFISFVLTFFSFLTSAYAATYYVDNKNGNDLNNGLNMSSPWQSLSKVNSFSFSPNDSILFIRNGVWRGQLIPQSGSALGYITYSDYGKGEKPLLLGSVNKSATSDWINEGGNIWRCSVTFSTDIGNLIFNNASTFGFKKWKQSELLSQGDYWYDLKSGELNLFSTKNPSSYYSDIECALRNHIIHHQNVRYAVFNNLALKYGAAHGFGGGNTSHLIIRACEISYIGGGDLEQDGSNIRFGNGIEFWGNAHNNIVEQCKIWEIYDTGLSNQNKGNTVQQSNIYYRNNIIYNCALASFEYWNKPASSTTSNIYFENNTCVNAGFGWGMQRPDRKGAHILFFENEAITESIYIRNNIFYKANACFAMPINWNQPWAFHKLILSNNCYYQSAPTDTLVYFFYSIAYNTSSFASYQTNTGLDMGSFIGDPLFVNYSANDFHLTATSPVINKGYPTDILNDFDNELRISSIDIGADEFYQQNSVIEKTMRKYTFSVFPNPASTTITIDYSEQNGKDHFQIFDLTGRVLMESMITKSAQINIEDLPSGLYFIRSLKRPSPAIKFMKK